MKSKQLQQPDEWKIEERDDGSIVASGGTCMMTHKDEGGRIFMRNLVHVGTTEHRRILVGEMDGVRVYVFPDRIILSKRDLYP